MKTFFLTLCAIIISSSLSAQKVERIAFYNVENLFDTINGPNKDEEFLPDAKRQWDTKRYFTKIKHINQVICELNTPMITGFCELENKEVLQGIINNNKKLKSYSIVHFDSEDARGIDVGMIYNSKKVKLLDQGFLRFILPGQTEPSSRDILWGKFSHKKVEFFILVNHWPSRRGGTEASAPKRIKASSVAKKFIDSLLFDNPSTRILLMGDLNDYPTNESVLQLGEVLSPCIKSNSNEFGGTNSYKGQWNILDHIMISSGFQTRKLRIKTSSGVIYSPKHLLSKYKGNTVPFRTFGGINYLNGYSDHLPVYVELERK